MMNGGQNEGWFGEAGGTETTEKTFDPGLQHGGRQRIARRVIEGMIDEALDRAVARSDQRARIYRARNSAFAAIDHYLKGRDTALCPLVEAELREQIRRLFASDPIDVAPFDARRARPDHRRVVETIAQSVREAHAALTPPQSQVIAGYVRANLGGWGERSIS